MPNWCDNELVIEGEKEEIERFKEKAKDEEGILSFSKFLPIPEKVNSYDWCMENWGTKWDAVNVGRCENDGAIEYSFGTAWSPPTFVVKKMCELFPNLKFELRYFEAGVGFNGIFVCEKGEVKTDICSEYFG